MSSGDLTSNKQVALTRTLLTLDTDPPNSLYDASVEMIYDIFTFDTATAQALCGDLKTVIKKLLATIKQGRIQAAATTNKALAIIDLFLHTRNISRSECVD